MDLIITKRLLEKFFNEELDLVHKDKTEIGKNNFMSVKTHVLTSQSYVTIVKIFCHFIPKQYKQLVWANAHYHKIIKLKLIYLILFHKTGAPKLDKSSLLNRCYIRFWGCNPKYDLPVASIFPINIVSYFLNPGILFWIGSDVHTAGAIN